jgi:hypothetical protein
VGADESILRGGVAGLNDALVAQLIAEGETRVVERKEAIPRGVLGPAAASLANTLGGWVLIGVTDAAPPEVRPWTPPGTASVQDFIRDRLTNEVDPVPPFAAAGHNTSDGPIAVVRVYESTDTPHLIRRTVAVYVREQGGKRPATHAEVRDLATKGERARVLADARIAHVDLDYDWLPVPELPFRPEQSVPKTYRLTATPLTVGPRFHETALTEALFDRLAKSVLDQLVPEGRHVGRPRSFAQHAVLLGDMSIHDLNNSGAAVSVAVDERGVLELRSARAAGRDDAQVLDLPAQRDMYFRALLVALHAALAEMGLSAVSCTGCY